MKKIYNLSASGVHLKNAKVPFLLVFVLLITLVAKLSFGQETVSTVPSLEGSNVNICQSGTATFSVDNSSSGHIYRLYKVGVGIIQDKEGNGSSITFTPLNFSFVGTYTYRVFDINDGDPYIQMNVNVVANPIAPDLSKTPNAPTVLAGTYVSATSTDGSGGYNCTDNYEYRTRVGNTWGAWSSYTPSNTINTTSLSGVEIKSFRQNGTTSSRGCYAESVVSWDVHAYQNISDGPATSYLTLQDAINAGTTATGEIIEVAAGTYPILSQVDVNKAITIRGYGANGTWKSKLTVDGIGYRFDVSAGATVENLEIEKTDKTGEQNIFWFHANNIKLQYNKIHGQFSISPTIDPEVSRAITISGGLSGLLIDNNTIYNFRQPAYISGTTTGMVSNNYTYNTKGWVLEGGNLTFTGNTWGINVFDIAILAGVPVTAYTDIVAMAIANNDAVIEDQRVSPAVLSVVHVNAGTSFTNDLGGNYHPYSTISPAVTRVVAGGKIKVAEGTYAEQVNLTKSLTINGANAGISPNGGTRVAESIIPLGSNANDRAFTVNTGYIAVTIDGFKLTGCSPLHDGNQTFPSRTTDVTFKNNIVQNGNNLYSGTTTVWRDVTITDNLFQNINVAPTSSAMLLMECRNAIVSRNVVNTTNYAGFLFEGIANLTVNENTINGTPYQGMQLANAIGIANVTSNILSNTNTNTTDFLDRGAIRLYGSAFTGAVNISKNIITLSQNGIAIKNGQNITGKNITISNNSILVSSGKAINHGGTGTLITTCNWFGTNDYPTILNKIKGPVVFVPFLLTSTIDPATPGYECGGGPASPATLTITHDEASKNILVSFTTVANDLDLKPIPGLDPAVPADLATITGMYQALGTAIAANNPAAIQVAALAIGDDVITEYYYYTVESNPATKTYLKTISNNDLVKNKYWQQYLVRDLDQARFPDWATNATVIDQEASYKTSTNPLTGAVAAGWLDNVLGRNLYVKVTFINNGYVNSTVQSVAIPAGCIVNKRTGFGYTRIQNAIDATTTIGGDIITVCAGTYNENISLNKSVILKGANAGVTACGTRVSESKVMGVIDIASNDITFDGFELTGTGAQIRSSGALATWSDITIVNNYIHATTAAQPILNGFGSGGGIGTQNWTISNNKIEDIQYSAATAIVLFNITNVAIQNNCIAHTNLAYTGRRGINADGLQTASINGNTIDMGDANPTTTTNAPWAIQIGMSDREAIGYTINGNTISNAYRAIQGLSQRNLTGLTAHNNTIGPASLGFDLNTGGVAPSAPVVMSGISIDNNSVTTVTPTVTGALGSGVRLRNLHNTIGVSFNNVDINENSFIVPSADKAIIFETGLSATNTKATCNWYGTAVSSEVAAKIIGNVQFLPFLSISTDNETETIGFQPVPESCGGIGPVVNVTNDPDRSYMTIQAAIDASTTVNNDVITVAAGTYNEQVDINKNISLIGAGITQTIITGGNPAVLLSASGTESSHLLIKDLKIEGLNGIRTNIAPISYLDLTNIWIKALTPTTGEGFRVVSNHSLTHWTVQGSTIEGFYDGIIVEGIIQQTGLSTTLRYVDFSNSVIKDNKRKGMYVETLSDATFTNVEVGGNGNFTAQTGNPAEAFAYGFDINLKNGNYANLTFNNMNFHDNGLNTPKGGALIIKARDDGDTYGANPATLTNVIINGGTFVNNERGISFGEPGKNNSTPTNVSVNNATITGNVSTFPTPAIPTGGIINATVVTTNATCNWYGTAVSSEVAAKISGNVQFLPFSTSASPMNCSGIGPVVNVTNDPDRSYMTIQAAINASTTIVGDVIEVSAGTYPETLLVNKTLTLLGPNAAISPNTGSRVLEAIITGGLNVDNASSKTLVIKGFRFSGVSSPLNYNGNASGVVTADFTFENNIVDNSSGQLAIMLGTDNNAASAKIRNNKFLAMSGNAMQLDGGATSTLTNVEVLSNVIDGTVTAGINTGNIASSTISSNTISNTTQQGIQVAGKSTGITISQNTITYANTSLDADRGGIRLYGSAYTGQVDVIGNIISNSLNGVAIRNTENITGKLINVTSNNLAGNVKGIYHGGTGVLNATCNWYGTAVSSEVAAKISGDVSFLPFSTSASPMNCSGIGPVVNVTNDPDRSYMTIQAAINASTTDDVIEVNAGTYPENLSVNKGVTLKGANAGVTACGTRVSESKVMGVIDIASNGITFDGFELTGTGAQIRSSGALATWSNLAIINNYIHATTAAQPILNGFGYGGGIGAQNWTISNNKIEDIQTADATAIALFNIEGVIVQNNCISHSNSSFNGRRGINFDGLQTVNFSGNTVNLGLTNLASDNSDGAFTKARYPLQLSSGNRGTTNVTINGNTLGGAYDGIITLGNGVFDGVNITNNTISNVVLGIRTQAGTNGPTGSVSNFIVHNNSISSSNRSIYLQDGGIGTADPYTNVDINNNSLLRTTAGVALEVHAAAVVTDAPVNATCNWYGTDVSSDIAAKIIGNVEFLPFSTSASPMNCSGIGPVVNVTNNPDRSYMTIQAAINASTTIVGDVIEVNAGTYPENLSVNKGVTLKGANAGVTACVTRESETKVMGVIDIASNDITFDGFELTGTGAQIRSSGALATWSDITIVNNYIHATTAAQPILNGFGYGGGIGAQNWTISNNKIEDIQSNAATAIALFNITNTTIQNNCIAHTNTSFSGRRGINADGLQTAIINGNTIDMGDANPTTTTNAPFAIQIGMSERDAKDYTINENKISNAYRAIQGLSQHNLTGLTAHKNTIGPASLGFDLNTGGTAPIAPIVMSGISIDNNSVTTVTPTASGALGSGVRLRNLYSTIGVSFNNVDINENSFTVPTAGKAIIFETGLSATNTNATCNWYGTTVPAAMASLVNGNVNYTPWLTSGTDGSENIGFQPSVSCDNTPPADGLLTMYTTLYPTGLTSNPSDNLYTITTPLSFNGIDVFQGLSVVVTDANLNTTNVPVFINGNANGYMQYDGANLIWNYAGQTSLPAFSDGVQAITATFLDNAGNTTPLTLNFSTDATPPAGGSLTMFTTLYPTGLTANPSGNLYTITTPLSFNGIDVLQGLSVVVTDLNLNTAKVPVIINGDANGYMKYDLTNLIWNYAGQTSAPEFIDGTQTITATFTDILGNSSLLSLNFTTDATIPVISLTGNSTVSICQGTTYTDAGATAIDPPGVNISANILTSGFVSIQIPGSYTITYNVTDAVGNPAVQVTRTVIVKPNPTFTAVTPSAAEICNGGSSSFTATGLLNGDNYFNYSVSGPGGPYTGNMTGTAVSGSYTFPANTYTGPGTYNITINSVTVNGCTTSLTSGNTASFIVKPYPTFTAVTPSASSICNGGSLFFTASGLLDGDNNFNYTVSGPGGPYTGNMTGTAVSGSYTFPANTYTGAGTYNITINSVTVNGCTTSLTSGNTATFTVVPDPTISISGGTSICAGSSAILTATTGDGTGAGTIQWYYYNGTSWTIMTGENGITLTVNPAATTDYHATYSCTGNGCNLAISNAQTIAVKPNPTISGVTVSLAPIVCNGSPISFTATGLINGVTTFNYTVAIDGGTPVAASQEYTVVDGTVTFPAGSPDPGKYDIVIVSATVNECTTTFSANNTATFTVVPDPTISISGETAICAGSSVILTATTGNGTGIGTIQWYYYNGTSWTIMTGENGITLTVNPAATTDYHATYSCTGNGCNLAISNAQTITVKPNPTISGVTVSPAPIVCNGSPVSFTATGLINGVTTFNYTVAINGGTPVAASQEYTVVGGTVTFPAGSPDPGVYNIVIVSATVNGCTTTFSANNTATFTVVPDPAWVDYTFPTTSICNGGSVTFSAGINAGLGGVISWIKSNNAVPGAGTEVTVNSPDSPGIGTWYYRPHYAPTGQGCDLADGTQSIVTVATDPSWLSNSVLPTAICYLQQVTFSATIANGLGGTIAWYRSTNPDGTGGILVSNPDTPPVAGTYYYYPTYTPNGMGCNLANGNITTVLVNPLPTPAITGLLSVCANSSGNVYSTPAVAGHSFLWTVAGATTFSGQGTSSITVTWAAGASGTVSVTEYNQTTLCTGSNTISVVLNPLPIPAVNGPATALTETSAIYSTATGYAYTWAVTGATSFTGQGTSSINVTWGAPGTGTVSVTALNISTGCVGASASYPVTITSGGYMISGYYTYHNSGNTPLDNISLNLKSGATTITSTTTGSNGYYQFLGVSPGTYTIVATTTKPVEGAINTTDAGAANSWWVSTTPIERVQFNAGDVSYDPGNPAYYINATDAYAIQYHFVYATPFMRGNWTFAKQAAVSGANPPTDNNAIIVTSSDVVQNYYGLCVGDFNRSYAPPSGKVSYQGSSSLALEYSGTQQMGPETEFDLPVYVTTGMQVGAISLIMNYPADLASVQGVYLADGNNQSGSGQNLSYNIIGNELRIGWTAIDPLELSANGELITIRMKTSASFGSGQTIQISLASDILNELADGFAIPINNVVLSTNIIEATTTGINELSSEPMILGNHPNPFTDFTMIKYTLPTGGKVVLELHNMVGARVATLVDAVQLKGKYELRLNGENLNPGIYTVTVKFTSGNTVLYRTIKLVHNR